MATGRFGNGDNEGDEDVDDSTTSSERDQLDDQPQTTTDDSNGDGDSDSNATAAQGVAGRGRTGEQPLPYSLGRRSGGKGWLVGSVGQENLPWAGTFRAEPRDRLSGRGRMSSGQGQMIAQRRGVARASRAVAVGGSIVGEIVLAPTGTYHDRQGNSTDRSV
ncbi:hypothetical protein D8S78_24765 [Natrialba swarupiae]|nr:hypothetical protein [Natrialba swarupiae]